MLAAAAWARGFAAAPRQAFVADGAEIKGTTWRRHFSPYTPMLDFIHAISRVFPAALAGRKFVDGWPVYCRGAQWLWSGRIADILVELQQRQIELGLPMTSSLMESTVKQVSRRVKGTEKFWSETGSDTMLQLRADYLSDTDPMPAFWEKWQRSASGQRPYSTCT